MKKLGVGIVACVAALLVANPANAAADLTLSVENVTNNNPGAAALASQFTIDVMNVGTGVQFIVNNAGPQDSTIANLYFGGSGMALLDTSAPILPSNWAVGSSPPQLPGAPSSFMEIFATDANNPKPHRGIEEGESAAFGFNYNSGANFAALLSALNSNNLQVGFHLISIDIGQNDYSDSYLSTPGEMVPVPAPLGLAAVGFAFVALRRRKASLEA